MEGQTQQRKRRTSIMKKSKEGPREAHVNPNKARRVSFSATVNMKLFRKDEAMASPASSPRRPRVQSPKRTSSSLARGGARTKPATEDLFEEEEEDKENLPPHPLPRHRPASPVSSSLVTMPLKGGSFHSSLEGDDDADEEQDNATGTFALDHTRRFMDESMDLTLPLPHTTLPTTSTTSTTSSSSSSFSSSSPPSSSSGGWEASFGSPSSPPALSRTIILNEDLDLTAVHSGDALHPTTHEHQQTTQGQASSSSSTATKRIARRRSGTNRRSSSHASSPPGGDRTVVFDTTMDLTLPLPSSLATDHAGHLIPGDMDCTGRMDLLEDQEEAHTVLLGTTMDLTKALDCSVQRLRASSASGDHPKEEEELDDATLMANAMPLGDRTQMIDQTMDLTSVVLTSASSPTPSRVPHDDHPRDDVGGDQQDCHTTTMDLTSALMEYEEHESMNTTSHSLPLPTGTDAGFGEDSLLMTRLRQSVVQPELARKQWGFDTLAELTKPTEASAKELERQITPDARAALPQALVQAATKKATLQAQSLLQLWSNDVEQCFNSTLLQHAAILDKEHEETTALIEHQRTAIRDHLAAQRRRTLELQDLVEITRGLAMWELRSCTNDEVSLIFRARPPLQPYLVTLQLGASSEAEPSRAVTKAALAALNENAGGAGRGLEGCTSFVKGLVKGVCVQGLLQQLTCTSQLRPVLEELTFRLERVQLLLADIDRLQRLSPLVDVRFECSVPGGCGLRVVFSLMDRGCKFAVRFDDLHYGFPYADLRWSLHHSFGRVDRAALTRLIERHTSSPAHGLLTRLARDILEGRF